MVESQKTENVDLNKFLSDLNACSHIVQELVSLETNSIRMVCVCYYKLYYTLLPLFHSNSIQAALDQLSLTLCYHRNVLLAKKRQLERSSSSPDVTDRLAINNGTGGSIVCSNTEDSHAKR